MNCSFSLLQKQYCNLLTEVCCRIEVVALPTTIGAGSAVNAQRGSAFGAQSSFGKGSSQSSFGKCILNNNHGFVNISTRRLEKSLDLEDFERFDYQVESANNFIELRVLTGKVVNWKYVARVKIIIRNKTT